MPEDRWEEYKFRAVRDGLEGCLPFNETVNMFGKNLVQLVEDRSFFPSSEDEAMGVEHLLAEPKCNDLGDDVLGFNSFNQHKCFEFGEFSAVEFGSIKDDSGALDSKLDLCQKVNEFSNDVLGGHDTVILDAKYNLTDTCEDYLLDTEFADESSDGSQIKGSYLGNLDLESKSMVAGNLVVLPAGENETKMILQTDKCSEGSSSPFTGVFNFKRKPRVQHAKRDKNDNHVSAKALSSEAGKSVSGFSGSVENENALVTRKRSRKPTRRYIEESLEEDSRHQKRRYGTSSMCSKGKILHDGSYKQLHHKRLEAKPFVFKKTPFKGTCIQVPFGEPVQGGHSSKKEHVSVSCKGGTLQSSNIDSDVESLSNDSQDEVSENDYSTGTKTHKGKNRRKHHIYWSISEVLKLVEGVSKYGVGRWTEIKKLQFRTSSNRTSVDLKDKWRNLLRASCLQLQSSREVESRKKHASQSIPQSILHRVRELAARHPYPRERKTQVSHTDSVASPVPATTCDNLVHFSTAVKV
ncbi:hypothetical protein NMG60_11033210 [Bertholletia excelsa]